MQAGDLSLPGVDKKPMTAWEGMRVLVLGAARQGIALTRWLLRQGALVTISDQKRAEDMQPARDALAGSGAKWVFGDQRTSLLKSCDLVCLSGGIPASLPIVAEAVKQGIPISNDAQIFMENVPCRTVGITGSAGKTTTTSLVGAMARAAADQPRAVDPHQAASPAGGTSGGSAPRVFVGGNIGDPLINYVDDMGSRDLAILELSSFQLEYMSRSPSVAAVLNVTPNHLDRHGGMAAYAAAKRRILEFQQPADTAVLNRDDSGSWGMLPACRGRVLAFSRSSLEDRLDGAFLADGLLSLRTGNAYLPLLPRGAIRLRGEHNLSNVLAAFAIGQAAGLPIDPMLKAASEFEVVPHRLEFIRELRGARWYNDSIGTAPERTIAAVKAFDEPIVLLLGGRDKALPWDNLAGLVARRVDHVVLFGEAAPIVAAALTRQHLSQGGQSAAPRRYSLDTCETLEAAVGRAAELAGDGDVVLLSPGGTSFDEFVDFEERGDRYREWVRALS